MRKPDRDCHWLYKRAEGDVEIWAPTKLDALRQLRNHGFIVTDPDKILIQAEAPPPITIK